MPNEIEDKIHKLDLKMGVMLAHLQNEIGTPSRPGTVLLSLAEIRGDVRQIERMLLGSNGHAGISVRLDRLEQSHKVRARLEVAGITALAGLLIKAVWEILVHVH
jgi:hypothetical protein